MIKRRNCVLAIGAAGWVMIRIASGGYTWDLQKLNRPRPRHKGTRYRGFSCLEIGKAPRD